MPSPVDALGRLTGLLHPEWGLTLGPGPGPSRARAALVGVRLAEERRAGEVAGGAPVEEAVRCAYDGATSVIPLLIGLCALSTFRGAALIGARAEPGARVEACDLTGARLEQPALSALLWSGCSLRDARVQGGALGRLSHCDAVGARLHGVRIEGAIGCDLSVAWLRGCDLRGADLRGARLVRADLADAQLDGALVDGADFTGAAGLTPEQRRRLIEGGARLRGAGWMALAARLRPGSAPDQQHRLATWLQRGVLLAGLGLAGGATALALRPPPPPEMPPLPPALERSVTAEDRRRSQQALNRMREAIAAAHAEMAQRGAINRPWPTLAEVQDNRYDADGDGPGEVQELLVPEGLPDNTLTDSRGGVLPYCNESPDQATLSGVDTDWHYCELTGRIFASAGFTGEATLNW